MPCSRGFDRVTDILSIELNALGLQHVLRHVLPSLDHFQILDLIVERVTVSMMDDIPFRDRAVSIDPDLSMKRDRALVARAMPPKVDTELASL